MAFRTNRQALLDRFDWKVLSPERVAQLEAVILTTVRNNFLLPAAGISRKGTPDSALATKEE
jgi:hypothetical protein